MDNSALSQAMTISKRVAALGFDWPDASGPRAKIIEEMGEIDAATTQAERSEEFGDLLFSVVNWARHLGVVPEDALRAANAKFEGRFAAMETLAGAAFPSLTLDQMEALWARVKGNEF
jgi:ATP diphosphatase